MMMEPEVLKCSFLGFGLQKYIIPVALYSEKIFYIKAF